MSTTPAATPTPTAATREHEILNDLHREIRGIRADLAALRRDAANDKS